MNIVKFLAIFGGSAFTVGVLLKLLVRATPQNGDDKVNEMAWTAILVGALMIAGAVVLNENGGLRLP